MCERAEEGERGRDESDGVIEEEAESESEAGSVCECVYFSASVCS